ncbi:hypothetical protein FVEN_g5452 [Fusarium venenatum]|uniref:Chromo domain-containing protein n=1 Tax=Fusarium venenatum TaxID=56646 RepID=A0A2L2U251_9HYPO|nr:uncharacterized protein FVRRES_08462 [Fusarium venenatum]KAG8356949.1 hypothetical protein FVEN_g5452 [Fusarium venenatum]KAH6965236.1 hypothetical protein EDB82DRAFT_511948 [Fusarium venenatum]CEI68385.1 unnamed protein product [Fusarium venenatum]
MESIQQQLEPTSSKKRKPHESRESRVAVRVPARPKDYIPGKGPELQRISLLPPQDSTAYILERIILPSPGLAADGNPLPRRMTYIVAWHDLPAAQLLVPAMDILEYVSPRELEEWEFANTEEQMDKEIEKEQTQTGDAPKPRRRGRPPKHSKIETAVVAVPDDDDNAVQRGAMTIATPTKNRLKDFEGLSDEDATPAQLQWETTGESAGTDDQGLYGGGDSDGFGSTRAGAQTDQLRDSGSQYHGSKQNHPPVIEIESSSSATSSRQSTPKVTAIKSASKGKRRADKPKKKTAMNGALNGLQATESTSESVWSPQETVTYSNSGVETPDPEPSAVTARLIGEAASMQKKKSKNPKSEKHSKSESRPSKVAQPPQQDPVQSTEHPEEPEEPEEPDWEVKRIEGMEMYEAEGGDIVRYFKVRWEGDWPPDQNPTWEPESNLPDQLVRRYLKNRKRKRPEAQKRTGGEKPKKPAAATQSPVAPTYKSRKSMKQTTLSWGIPAKQFRSVAEAFEGLEEDELSMPHYDKAPIQEQDEDQDELFIVEEPLTKKSRV